MENVAVNYVAGITILVGDSPFLLIDFVFLSVILDTVSLALLVISSPNILLELRTPFSPKIRTMH